MICSDVSPDFTKSSVFSLLSTATAISVNKNMQKKKVTKNFLSMYQSSLRMRLKSKRKIVEGRERNCYIAYPFGAEKVDNLEPGLEHWNQFIFPSHEITRKNMLPCLCYQPHIKTKIVNTCNS